MLLLVLFSVILAPYGIRGHLTGRSYQQNGIGVSKLIDEWKRFFPLHVVDDWSNVPEGTQHDIPVVVGVNVGGNVIKCPSHYVLVSLDDAGKILTRQDLSLGSYNCEILDATNTILTSEILCLNANALRYKI